jgi:hypothetical protein
MYEDLKTEVHTIDQVGSRLIIKNIVKIPKI